MKTTVKWWHILSAVVLVAGALSILWAKQSQSSHLPPIPAGVGLDYSKLSEEEKQTLKEREERDKALAQKIQKVN